MNTDDIGGLTYERSLAQLDDLIAKLEAGSVDLQEAIVCYERATRLAQHCSRLLDETEQRVTQLVATPSGVREEPVSIGRGDEGVHRSQVARAVPLPLRPGKPPVDPDDIPF